MQGTNSSSTADTLSYVSLINLSSPKFVVSDKNVSGMEKMCQEQSPAGGGSLCLKP